MQKVIEKLNPPNLSKYGIHNVEKIYYNLSYDELFKHETDPSLEGYEKGFVTNLGAVTVDTGIFTGRSPKDKYIVKDSITNDTIWWADKDKKSSDNNPISEDTWNHLLDISQKQLSQKKLYVMDAFCGANENTRINIRVITEVAWAAHFVKNMFIRPTEEELQDFEPDFVMLHACKAVNEDWEKYNLNSEIYVAFNLKERMAVVGGTWYGGEIKKGFFSIMNYYLPLQKIASMHCSANMGKNGDTAIFFGLSGTGKTTLSADPDRYLIGDDEHGWDKDGVFNFEGGCYAKCINLKKEKEPDIYNAIKRDALLENVVYDPETGEVNFSDTSKTENTRVSYPIYHIKNIVKPVSKGIHPKNIIFLTADAFGVFPPVAKLTKDQAMYYFLSGYTAKLAGTEREIKEPIPTFSSAFGAAFLLLHPTVYAKELAKKMEEHDSTAYLVNTGWIGGSYGIGKRIDITVTRNIINAILDGSLEDAEYEELPIFELEIPKTVNGVDSQILNPRNTWKYESAYLKQANMLAEKFIENFSNFTDTEEGQRLMAAGPQNELMKQYYKYYKNKIKKLEDEHNEEIKRLKDQIYILQNSFSQYISFNSINSDYKKKPLKRHIPVIAWFDNNVENNGKKFHDELIKLMKTAGFKIYNREKTKEGFCEYITRSTSDLTLKQVYGIIDDLENAFKQHHNDKLKYANQRNKLMEAARKYSSIVIKIGSLLIIKKENENGQTEWLTKKASISGLIHVDKNPSLLKEPKRLIEEITFY